jgi:hypothetical protein
VNSRGWRDRVRKSSLVTQLLRNVGVVFLQLNASEYGDCDSLSRFRIARGFMSAMNDS